MKPCSHPVVLPRHPAIRFKDKSERSVLLLPLYALLWSFVARSALVPLQSVVIPETVLSVDSPVLCHYKQIVIQPAHASFPVVLLWARVHPSSAGETFTITVGSTVLRVTLKFHTFKFERSWL